MEGVRLWFTGLTENGYNADNSSALRGFSQENSLKVCFHKSFNA